MEIIQLPGTDKALYIWVGPLVMNPKVLRQNYNFPFRTSERFEWFIAVENDQVQGFMPLEHKHSENCINNYYVKDKNPAVLSQLLERVIETADKERSLTAVCFLEDKDLFAGWGFEIEKKWTRYVKMRKRISNGDGETEKEECI